MPPALQAMAWQSPCAVDLSPALAGRAPTKLVRGDELAVSIATSCDASDNTRIQATVAEDGTIDLPNLGRIAVAGSSPDQAQRAVIDACHRQSPSQRPRVHVCLQQPHPLRITVTGAVQRPGIYELPRQNCDVVSALAAAGGLCRDAGATLVIQSRPSCENRTSDGELQITDSLQPSDPVPPGPSAESPSDRREIQLTSASAANLAREELKEGDVIVVERRDPPSIVVSGMVLKPGRYEIPVGQEYRVLDAIASAQGVSYKVLDTLVVCREAPGQSKRALIQVSLREATRNQDENIILMPGDVVSVETNARLLIQDVTRYVGLATVAVGSFFIHF
jgi:polysaccharide export outer membrane protein